jgi:hypothetical protein
MCAEHDLHDPVAPVTSLEGLHKVTRMEGLTAAFAGPSVRRHNPAVKHSKCRGKN